MCLSAGGVRACRCATHVHITCLAPLILSAGFKCRACGGGFNKAVVAALARRLVATHGMTPKRRYLLCWALVRDSRAEEVLKEARTLTAEATDFPTSRRANIRVFKGRALLQLGNHSEAIAAFRSARVILSEGEKSRTLPPPEDDCLDIYANALLGLGLSYMQRGWHERAATCLRDARTIIPFLAHSTVVKIMRASAAQASAQGDDEGALELLTSLHRFSLQHEKDTISLAETSASVQTARGHCKGRTANRDVLRRCLHKMRRDGRREIVAAAAQSLAAHLRPRKRLRAKSHPEDVAHRKRHRTRQPW